MKKLRVLFKGILRRFHPVLRFVAIPMYCKKCGIELRDFHVDPEIWFAVEQKTGYSELCYNCFCDECSHLGISYGGVWYLVPGPIQRGEVLCRLQIAKDPDDGVCPLYSGCVNGHGERRIINIAESRIVFSYPVKSRNEP